MVDEKPKTEKAKKAPKRDRKGEITEYIRPTKKAKGSNGRGRPSIVVTDQDVKLAGFMKLAGHSDESIAEALKISVPSFHKKVKPHIKDQLMRVDAMVSAKLYSLIQKGNASAIFFYLKTQCGWRENNTINLELDLFESRFNTVDERIQKIRKRRTDLNKQEEKEEGEPFSVFLGLERDYINEDEIQEGEVVAIDKVDED